MDPVERTELSPGIFKTVHKAEDWHRSRLENRNERVRTAWIKLALGTVLFVASVWLLFMA